MYTTLLGRACIECSAAKLDSVFAGSPLGCVLCRRPPLVIAAVCHLSAPCHAKHAWQHVHFHHKAQAADALQTSAEPVYHAADQPCCAASSGLERTAVAAAAAELEQHFCPQLQTAAAQSWPAFAL